MLEWLFWEQYSHEPYVAVARFQVRYLGKSPDELEPRIVERARGALRRLDEALGAGGFLVGARISLADVALVAYTRWAGEGGLMLAPYGALRTWIGRVEQVLRIAD
jgi:glutathione S-transferase